MRFKFKRQYPNKLIPKEIRDKINKSWLQHKILNLDFRGLDRGKIPSLAKKLLNIEVTPMVLYMGDMFGKRNRTMAVVEGNTDSDFEWCHSKDELLEAVAKRFSEGKTTFEVEMGHEEVAKENGRMDLTGQEQSDLEFKVINGRLGDKP